MTTMNIHKDYSMKNMVILKKYGKLLLRSEQYIGGDEPYIITTLCIDGKIQKMKFK